MKKWPWTKYLKHLLWIKSQVEIDDEGGDGKKGFGGNFGIPSMPSFSDMPRNASDLKRMMRQMRGTRGRSAVSQQAYQFK